MTKLSPRQEGMLKFIRDFLDEHQYPPTVRDIQRGCKISSTSVVDYNLHILQRDGYIRRFPEVSRGIEILDGKRSDTRKDTLTIPLIGYIAAGEPIPIPSADTWSRPEPLETLEMPSSITRGKREVYALRVKGRSMVDDLIDDGDIVFMEPVRQANNGEMVAAWLKEEGEATLKKFYLEGDKVRLQPANSQMQPIVVRAQNVEVHGRVLAVLRYV